MPERHHGYHFSWTRQGRRCCSCGFRWWVFAWCMSPGGLRASMCEFLRAVKGQMPWILLLSLPWAEHRGVMVLFLVPFSRPKDKGSAVLLRGQWAGGVPSAGWGGKRGSGPRTQMPLVVTGRVGAGSCLAPGCLPQHGAVGLPGQLWPPQWETRTVYVPSCYSIRSQQGLCPMQDPGSGGRSSSPAHYPHTHALGPRWFTMEASSQPRPLPSFLGGFGGIYLAPHSTFMILPFLNHFYYYSLIFSWVDFIYFICENSLDSQQNCEEGTEAFHRLRVPTPCLPHYLHPHQTVYLLSQMNLHQHVIITQTP